MLLTGIVGNVSLDVAITTIGRLERAGRRQEVPTALTNPLVRLLEQGVVTRCQIKGNRVTLTLTNTLPDGTFLQERKRLKHLSTAFTLVSGQELSIEWTYETQMVCHSDQSGITVEALSITYAFLRLLRATPPQVMIWEAFC